MTIKQYSSISEEQLIDKDFMLAQKRLYMDRFPDSFDGNTDYKKIVAQFNRLVKAEEKEQKAEQTAKDKAQKAEQAAKAKALKAEQAKIDKQQKVKAKEQEVEDKLTQKLANSAAAKEEFEAMVRDHVIHLTELDMYHVADGNKIHVRYPGTTEWYDRSKNSNYTNRGIVDINDQKAFDVAMMQLHRMKDKAVYSFYDQPGNVLNKMGRDNWLQPNMEDIKYHDAIDIMLLSMAGGRFEIVDHIESIIYWKYTHPEDYTIPCLSIFGVGGLGKNTFVNKVLGGIFGKEQVVCLSFADITQYSGLLDGKAFVYLDEMIADDVSASRLKLMVGNETITLNTKGGSQRNVDSTAAWITGGNDNIGNFLLDGTGADRRWSIIKSNTSVEYWTGEIYKTEDKGEIKQMMQDNLDVLEDPVELSKWLGHLITKYDGMKTTPLAWHGDDYNELLHAQKNSFDDFAESVFNDEFDWIKRGELQELYSLFIDKYYEGSKRYKKGRNKFYAEIEDWVKKNRPDIKKQKKWYEAVTRNKHQAMMFFVANKDDSSKCKKDNYYDYFRETKHGKIEINTNYFDDILQNTKLQLVKPEILDDDIDVGIGEKD